MNSFPNNFLQPIEHKWIVRILLQKMEIGFNFNSILDYYNPHAMKLYSAFNNMKELCKRLSDPKYVTLLKMTHEQNAKDIVNQNRCVEQCKHYAQSVDIGFNAAFCIFHVYREIWRPQSQIPPEIQKTISPMLSHRTSFDSYLKEVAHRHHELDKVLPVNSPAKSSLALIHPAIACEIKMDGERMLVHVKRGIVTMHVGDQAHYFLYYFLMRCKLTFT
jgi:ATP-dependent DNA ligase